MSTCTLQSTSIQTIWRNTVTLWVQAGSNNNVQRHFFGAFGNLDKGAQICPSHFFHFAYLVCSVSRLPSRSGCVYSLFFHKCIKHSQKSWCSLLTMPWHYWNECMNYNTVVEHWSPGFESKFHRTRDATQICAFLHVRAQTDPGIRPPADQQLALLLCKAIMMAARCTVTWLPFRLLFECVDDILV